VRKTAFRITQSRYASTAFDGEGARLNGGRWNSVGTRMVYTASSLSLATLELLVHTEDVSTLDGRYTVIPIKFDMSLVHTIDITSLPAGWNQPETISDTQILGDRWIQSMSSVLLEVPSVVTQDESNFLVNPGHPEFSKIAIGRGFVLKLDPRLLSEK
jgi:RES domain-containing protein